MCMSVCPCACLLPTCIPGVCIRKISDPLGLELEMVMSHGVGAGKLGINPPPGYCGRASSWCHLQPQSGSLQCETGQYFHVALSASVKLSNLNNLEKAFFFILCAHAEPEDSLFVRQRSFRIWRQGFPVSLSGLPAF